MAQKVRDLKAQGRDIVSLTLGEPDFDTPAHIRKAATDAIAGGDTHYPPVAGTVKLREAIAAFFQSIYKIPYTAANILVSTGAKQSLVNVLMSVVNPGDEVLIPAPYWVSYLPMTQMAEGKPVIITPKSKDLLLTADELEAAINPNTKLLMLNSPCNPSGSMYSKTQLDALVAVLEKYPHVLILSDEIYSLINYTDQYTSIATYPGLFNRVVTVNGVSKAFAMTGWRIGFAGGPEWIMKACEKFQGQVTSGASSISQAATLAAVSSDLQPTFDMVAQFRKRRDSGLVRFRAQLPQLDIATPQGAFYFYPNISALVGKKTPTNKVITNGDDVCDFLLEEGGVAVVSGVAFGTPNYIRLSYACSEETMAEAISRMQACIAKLV